MLANLRKFITKTAEAKVSRELDAEGRYAELIAKIAADGEISDGEVEAELADALALLEEVDRTIEDVEKDVAVYRQRLERVANYDRLESLTEIQTRAKAAYDTADKEYHDTVERLKQLRYQAAEIYQDASRQVTDARQAGDQLRRLLPSWMRREMARVESLPITPWMNDGGDKPPLNEHPNLLKVALEQYAGRACVWPLPGPMPVLEVDQSGHLLL